MPIIVRCRGENCLDEDGRQTVVYEPDGLEYPGDIIYRLGRGAAQDFKAANRKLKNFEWFRYLKYITPSCPNCRRELSYDVTIMGVKMRNTRDYVMGKLDFSERGALEDYEKWKEQQPVDLSGIELKTPSNEAVPARNPGKASGKKPRQAFPKDSVDEDSMFDELVRKRLRDEKS